MELKFLIFLFFLMMVIPISFVGAMDRRLLTLVLFCMLVIPIFFEATAINFFPMKEYRGTARGMEVSAVYLGALIICLSLLLSGFKFRLLAPGLMPFILLFALSALSMVNAENLLISVFELWKMAMLLLLFLAVYNYCLSSRNFETVIWGMAALVFYSFLVVLKDKYWVGRWQARGVFPHQNSMGMYLELIGPIFLAGWLNCRSFLKSYFFAMLFIITTASAVVSYSRGAILCYPIACAVTIFFSLRYHFNIRKMKIVVLVIAIGMLATFLFLPMIIRRFSSAAKESKETRIELAQVAVRMMKDKFLGVGINNWSLKMRPLYNYNLYYEENQEKAEREEEINWGIVETTYLLTGAECGWLGLATLLFWFAYMFLLNYRNLAIYERHDLFYLPAGICGGLIAVYLQSMLEWGLKQAVNYGQLMVIYALVSALYFMRHSLPQKQSTELVVKDF